MSEDRVYNVLFLCTYNSGRSIMAEAILNREGNGRFRAFSGGSHPTDQLNPHVVALLKKMNYPTDTMRSKDWSEFAQDDAPTMDFVITVCDQLAKETCPAWPGSPIKAHWGFPRPRRLPWQGCRDRGLGRRTFRDDVSTHHDLRRPTRTLAQPTGAAGTHGRDRLDVRPARGRRLNLRRRATGALSPGLDRDAGRTAPDIPR